MLPAAQGIPLAAAVSGANTHDSLALKPLIRGIPAVRSYRAPRRRRPVKLRADKAHFSAEHLAWLRECRLVARIARPGIESGERLGRHHSMTKRSIAWLFGYRRLTVRYERNGSHFLAFLMSQGTDAGKMIAGRKKSIATDTLGLLLAALVVTAASVQDSMAGTRRSRDPPRHDQPERDVPWLAVSLPAHFSMLNPAVADHFTDR